MRLRNEELMEEFYDRMLPKHSGLTLEEMTAVCHNQFHYLRDCIEGDELVEIRLKYLGSFQVYPGKAKNYLYNLKERLKFRKIEPQYYQRVAGMIERYLKRIGEL